MRKWYLPVTVLGVSSLGALLLSEFGRELLRSWFGGLGPAPKTFADWNDSVQTELDKIQLALNQLTDSLQPQQKLEH